MFYPLKVFAQANWDSAIWDAAIWDQTVVTHTVTPSATAGGAITPSVAQTVEDGETISFAIAANSGYQLSAVSGTCPGDLSGSTYTAGPIDSDCTVEASFYAVAATTYSVTISAGSNGEVSPSGTVTVNEGSTVTYTATADTGYYVQAWGGGPSANCAVDTYQVNSTVNGDNTNVTFVSTAILGECELNVGFEAISVRATPSTATAGGSVSPSTSQTDTYGSTIDFVLSPDAGYRVDRVEGTCPGSLSGDTYSAGPLVEDCTVLAYFAALQTFTVTPSAGTGGAIDPSTAQPVTESDTASFTLTPENGYQTDSVGGTCGGTLSGNAFTTSPITADCTVIGNFTEVVTLTYDLQGGSNGPTDQTGAADSEISLSTSSPTREGYTFLGWNTAADGSGVLYSSGDAYTLPNSGTATLYAQWEIKSFTVTPSAGTGGSISPSTQQLVNFNATVSFTLSPSSDYEVATVAGSCGGQLTGNVFTTDPISSDCTVKASFNLRSGTTPPTAPTLSKVAISATGATLKITPSFAGSDPITSYTTTCQTDSISPRASSASDRNDATGLSIGLFQDINASDRTGSTGRKFTPNPDIFHSQLGDTLTFESSRSVGASFNVRSTHLTLEGNRFIASESLRGDLLRMLIREDGNFFGSFIVGGEAFEARVENDETIFYLSDDGALATDPFLHDINVDELLRRPITPKLTDAAATSSNPTIFTVGVQYNPALSSSGIDYIGWMDYQIATTNASYQRSGLDVAFVVVGVRSYEPGASQDISKRRNFITCGSLDCQVETGENSSVASWRTSIKADFIVQLVLEGGTADSPGVCGIAQLPTSATMVTTSSRIRHYTYSVSAYKNADQGVCPSVVVAHEIGHNLSLMHNREMFTQKGIPWQIFPTVTSYGWGYQILNCYGTVMAYPACGFGGYLSALSTPAVSWNGYPMGTTLDSSEPSWSALTVEVVKNYYAEIYDNSSAVLNPLSPTLDSYSSTVDS
ncbi:InlB B-repeat-containing protein, partial [Luminiphilus sp.]|nr:InlB B-repeat-containing protein [Luminiphilus sp.]